MRNTHWRLTFGGLVVAVASLLTGCGDGSLPPAPVHAPAVTISPSTVSFPATSQGASSTPIVVTVTNSGNATLSISSVATGGGKKGDFATTNTCSGAINPMGTCTITVTFVPIAPGQRSEIITITDDAASSPQTINVSGTANPITLMLTPQKSAIATGGTLAFSANRLPA
jgi:hypothetical protein